MRYDIIIVGGGVGGCALAARMAGAGHTVLVLEREADYQDRVRGEGLVNWGYEQAVEMGLGETVRRAPGASAISRLVNYDETLPTHVAQKLAKDLSAVLPGTPGILGVGHPELRRALADAATAAGATVRFGVSQAVVEAGERPSVRYRTATGPSCQDEARLVVVADGKNSATRRALGIDLHVTRPRVMLTGLAVDDGGRWDRAETVIGVEGRNLFYVIPRGDGRIRLYLGRAVDDERFSGDGRERRFLDCFALRSLPNHDCLVRARPVGPCASFPMTDSWADSVLVPGVALIGDAAGWSNPVTGQGLAVALRDARVLSDSLLAATSWSVGCLASYADERAERMRRLRFASALTDLLAAFGAPERQRRRQRMFAALRSHPELGIALEAVHAGPWRVPAAGFSPDILTTLALA